MPETPPTPETPPPPDTPETPPRPETAPPAPETAPTPAPDTAPTPQPTPTSSSTAAPPSTPASQPTPAPQPTPTSPATAFKPVSTRRAPRKAVAAKVAGIVGIVICALIIVVVWLGLGTVSRAVNDLGNDVNASFDKAIAASDAVANRLDEAVTSLESIRTEAIELAASSSPDTSRLSGLQARLGQIADRYLEVRVRYAEARENVLGITSTLSKVARLIPGARTPEGLGDRLAALDSKLQAIDAALVSTATKLAEADPGKALADALAAQGTPLQDALSNGVTAVNGVSANLAGVQANADSAVDSIRTVLLIAAIALSVLFVWVLALNIALWVLGRSWERESERA